MPDALDLAASGTQVALLSSWLSSLTWVLFGLAALAFLVVVSGRTSPRRASEGQSEPRFERPPAILLFDGDELIDATEQGWGLLVGWDREDMTLPTVARVLAEPFGPSLPDDLRGLEEGTRLRREADGGRSVLDAEAFDGALRLVVTGWRPDPTLPLRLHLDAVRQDADLVRQAAAQSPVATWITDKADHVIWCNGAFDDVANRLRRVTYPSLDDEGARSLQPDETVFGVDTGASPMQSGTRRVTVLQSSGRQPDDAQPRRFDVTTIRTGDAGFHYAVDADLPASAESRRAGIIRSLSLAFAQLGDGVAVFDGERCLMAFNPAFADITGASLDFLGDHPRLSALLDVLHNASAIPEPANYQAWRASLLAIGTGPDAAAYDDSWALPDGRLLRVAGRGLPDGGLVVILHDATQEVAQVRQMRTRGDMALAALCSVELPILLIDADGRVAASTPAYEAGRMTYAGDPSPALRTEAAELEAWAHRWSLGALRSALTTPPRRPSTVLLAPIADAMGPAAVRVQGLPGGSRMFTFVRGWPGQPTDHRHAARDRASDLPHPDPVAAANGATRPAAADVSPPVVTHPVRREVDATSPALEAELMFRTRRQAVERPAISNAPAHIV